MPRPSSIVPSEISDRAAVPICRPAVVLLSPIVSPLVLVAPAARVMLPDVVTPDVDAPNPASRSSVKAASVVASVIVSAWVPAVPTCALARLIVPLLSSGSA